MTDRKMVHLLLPPPVGCVTIKGKRVVGLNIPKGRKAAVISKSKTKPCKSCVMKCGSFIPINSYFKANMKGMQSRLDESEVSGESLRKV